MSTYSRDEATTLINADSSKVSESPTVPRQTTHYPTYSPHEAFSLIEGQGILDRDASSKRSHSPLEQDDEEGRITVKFAGKKKKGNKQR